MRHSLFLKAALPTAILAVTMLTACDNEGPRGRAGIDGVDGVDGIDGADGVDGADGADGSDGQDATLPPILTRLATVPAGAEVTGLFKTDNGELFFNIQHPSDTLPAPENKAAVGVINALEIDEIDPNLTSVSVPATGSAASQTTQVAAGSYQAIGRAGDTFAGALGFGLGAIVNAAGTGVVQVDSGAVSENPDFNAFVPSNADGSQGFLFTAWEDRPGAMSRLSLTRNDQTKATASWTVTDAISIDFSPVGGTMINCFGTLSPWGTPLTSEENYEAENTAQWNNPNYPDGYPSSLDVSRIQEYLGGTFPNPYDFGYIVEITNPQSANPVPVKHFALGRMAHENPVVMPDNKTVYLTDDGTNKAFYKFVANTAGDLSAGTLYAAKLTQDATRRVDKAGFNIEWIELGSANNAQIEAWINEYDGKTTADYVEGSTSYITQAEIDDWAANGTGDDRYAFLESLRAAAAKGASVEFRKMEGVNINYDAMISGAAPYMYVAMSAVEKGMSDDSGDIQVEQQKCGAVYRFGLDNNWNATRMEPVVVGGPYDSSAAENRCAVDNISNPDNILVLNDGRVIIGEDTGNHVNNAIWIYNPEGK